MYRILMNNGTVVINELTGPKLLRRFMNWCFTKWPTGDHAVYSRAEMEQMLHTAGFQNIRSRMITPFSYVSVGRKKEEKPAMIKLAGLSDERVPVILDTDDKDKAARYEHLGMKLDRVRSCGERFHMYDLIRE